MSELSETDIDVVNDVTDDNVWNVYILRDDCQDDGGQDEAQMLQQLPSSKVKIISDVNVIIWFYVEIVTVMDSLT